MANGDDAFEDGPSRPRRSRDSNGGDSGSAGSGAIDPASLTGSGPADSGGTSGGEPGDDGYVRDADGNVKRNRDGSPRKKRGRKAGSKATSSNDLAASIAMMTVGVQALHGLAAIGLRAPEMDVSEAEAKALADPMVRLMDHYAVTPPPEMILWTNMFTALAAVEGPRIFLMRMRMQEERAAKAKPVYDSVRPATTGAPANPNLDATFGGGAAPVSGTMN